MQELECVNEETQNCADTVAPTRTSVRAGEKLTVEHALYAAVFGAAVAVRFWGLSRMPLNTLEAVNSLRAWQDAMGVPGLHNLAPTSPLLLHLQILLFWIGANGDAAARAAGAAAGSLLVLVPWLLRGFLGRPAAVVLSILFALDPWLVAFSRFADGAMLSTLLATALLSLLVILARQGASGFAATGLGSREGLDAGRRRTITIMIAVLGGLFLSSGHVAWSYLPVLVAFIAFNHESLSRGWQLDRITVGWFIGAFLIGSTGWLIRPGNISLVSASLTMWIDAALSTGTRTLSVQAAADYPLMWPVRALLADQPLVALFGLGGLIHMTWRRRADEYSTLHWRAVLWVWFAWGVILCLLPGRSPFSLLALVMPLLFAAAYSVSRLVHAAPIGTKRGETLAVAGTLLLLLVSAAIWGAALVSTQNLDMLMLQALLLILLLSAAIVVFYGVWAGWTEAIWSGIAVVGIALLCVNVGATWRVNHRFDLGRPGGLFAEYGAIDLRQLATDVETISAHRVGDPFEIAVTVDGSEDKLPGDAAPVPSSALGYDRDPLLAWYLRNMRRLKWGGGGPAEVDRLDQPLIITREIVDAEQASMGGADYVGSRYGIRSFHALDYHANQNHEAVNGIESSSKDTIRTALERAWTDRVQPWFRWALYREAGTPPAVENVILWAPRPQ